MAKTDPMKLLSGSFPAEKMAKISNLRQDERRRWIVDVSCPIHGIALNRRVHNIAKSSDPCPKCVRKPPLSASDELSASPLADKVELVDADFVPVTGLIDFKVRCLTCSSVFEVNVQRLRAGKSGCLACARSAPPSSRTRNTIAADRSPFIRMASEDDQALLEAGKLSEGSLRRGYHQCMAGNHAATCNGWTSEMPLAKMFGYTTSRPIQRNPACARLEASNDAAIRREEKENARRMAAQERRMARAAAAASMRANKKADWWREKNQATMARVRSVNPDSHEPEWIYGKNAIIAAVVVCPDCGMCIKKNIDAAFKSHRCADCGNASRDMLLAADRSRRKIISKMIDGSADGSSMIGVFYFVEGFGEFVGYVKPGITELGVRMNRAKRPGGIDLSPFVCSSLHAALMEAYVLHGSERASQEVAIAFCGEKMGGWTEVCVDSPYIRQRLAWAKMATTDQLLDWFTNTLVDN